MAQINIKDSFLKDDKFSELCIKLGSRIMALGVAVEAFILAQKHYLDETNGRLIPLNEWQRKPALHVLAEVGLAEINETGIYIKGSHDSFKWLLQKSDAGKKSAASKRIKRQKRSMGVERTSTEVNGAQPIPTSIINTTSNSSFNSNTNTSCENSKSKKPRTLRKASAAPDESDAIKAKTSFFIQTYCSLFKKQYGTSIDVLGKDVGTAKRLVGSLSEEKIQSYLEAYFNMPDSVLAKKKHPVTDFEYKFAEIVHYAQSGDFTTFNQSKQFDQMATINSQLARIKDGVL